MTTQPNINGVTLKEITGMMTRLEKNISFYNQKFAFDMTKASAKEQKKYNSLLFTWDFLKAKRDSLKTSA